MKNPSNFCCVRLTFFWRKKAEALVISLNTWRSFESLGLRKKNIVWYKNLFSCNQLHKTALTGLQIKKTKNGFLNDRGRVAGGALKSVRVRRGKAQKSILLHPIEICYTP